MSKRLRFKPNGCSEIVSHYLPKYGKPGIDDIIKTADGRTWRPVVWVVPEGHTIGHVKDGKMCEGKSEKP